MSNHRYSKWWWQDWRGDACLQRCSFAAKGLWMDVLCLLNDGQPYGHLRSADRDLTVKDLVELFPRSTIRQVTKLLDELETKRVFSRNEAGTIYCRRMVRDGNLSEKGTHAASKRWGKPNGSPNGSPTGKATARPYGPPTTQANGKPSAIDHSHRSESESARGMASPMDGLPTPLTETATPDPRANPETAAWLAEMEMRVSLAAKHPKPNHLPNALLVQLRKAG